MKKTKAFLCATAFIMAAIPALVACDSGEEHDYWVSVWCDKKIQALTTRQAKEWAKEMKAELKYDIGIKVNPVGEATAASNMIADPQGGADVFCFAQDQLSRLVSAGALQEITDAGVKARIQAENDAESYSAATIGDSLVAYPLTSDNTYVMYYDKSFFTDPAELADLSTIFAKCEAANKKVHFPLKNAWYNASVFYGFGCESEWKCNTDGTFYDVVDTYASQNGIKACKAIYEAVNTYRGTIEYDNAVSTAFAHKPGEAPQGAVCISGTWDYADAVSYLGDNLGAIEVPTVTVAGETVQLRPFFGCKLIGVKRHSNATMGLLSELLAEHLISKECQLERFQENGWGPSNLEAKADPEVQANVVLQAMEREKEYTVVQGQYPGDWWSAAAAISEALASEDCTGSDSEINAILRKYKSAIATFINGEPPEA